MFNIGLSDSVLKDYLLENFYPIDWFFLFKNLDIKEIILFQYTVIILRKATAPAIIDCIIMLSVPGSRYAYELDANNKANRITDIF